MTESCSTCRNWRTPVDTDRKVCVFWHEVYGDDDWCSSWDADLPFSDPPEEEE